MYSRFARLHGSHRAFAAAAGGTDTTQIAAIAALTGAAAGAAAALGVSYGSGGATSAPVPAAGTPRPDAGSTTVFKGETENARSKFAGEGSKWTKPIVIGAPALEPLARTLRRRVGSEEFSEEQGPSLHVEKFKSEDSNIKFNWERVNGRKVVLLFDTVDQSRFFEQLALLQSLQGFAVPDGDDKTTKWKSYVGRGKYSWGRASSITVVIPWYRPCQMERTSRWQRSADGKWTNSDPNGQWLDVPNAQYYARLLCTPGSVPPLPGPQRSLDSMPLNPLWRPPVELLFIELHEELPVSHAVSDLGATIRTERFVPYFLDKFKGKRAYPGKANMYVLFPDHGAYDRYAASVKATLSLDDDHILFIQKTRVGAEISQVEKLFYENGGKDKGEKDAFSSTDSVLIIDDFTNSGSTLFGAVNLVKKLTPGDTPPPVSIFVSHLVAAYDPKVVAGIKEKLHKMGPTCRFFTTNSIPMTTDLLKDDPQVEVVDISDYISDMVQ